MFTPPLLFELAVRRPTIRGFLLCLGVSLTLAQAAGLRADDTIRFNRDIRPILSDACFACHGPDAGSVKGGLRLDLEDRAQAPARSGKPAVVPGNPDESELMHRVLAADEEDRMPPPEAHKTLSTAQIGLLREWILQGAEYEDHWAYLPPVRPEVPEGAAAIDFLVGAHLERHGLEAAPKADRRTLVRRLHWDLVGLPAQPEVVEGFVLDETPDAWSRLIDQLLSSPHFGERMAMDWLDVVRFADTIGYHSDNPRNIWPYRDYVIDAFNRNKPFDQFTREQLAGDLLPNAGQEQQVGSAFNRLLLTTEEGGAQPKDYEARYLTDRVRAVSTVWLGQTVGCAQCHDHKFDPITSKDFYALGAFFADIEEALIGKREPGLLLATEEQSVQLEKLTQKVQGLRTRFDHPESELGIEAAFEAWIQNPETAAADKKVAEWLSVADEDRDDAWRDKVLKHFKSVTPLLASLREQLEKAEKTRADFENSIPRCLVTQRRENPRTVRILPRGDWMNESGEEVLPAFPEFLGAFGTDEGQAERRLTRLDLAEWLLQPENPLTARVVMNRLWRQFFGRGLSGVLDDLGAQGEPPTHPELLDWLAVEFVESGWDLKHMIRQILQSAAYQRSSTVPTEALARDPENRHLARQGRWRVEAELVRDFALQLAGVLELQVGGPSAHPYQPAGYWENLNFPPREYVASTGSDQYRRGVYTWWQRSFLHPSLLAFDAPTREECAVERNRSNIPQQALVLLNDPTYVEAARLFAARILTEIEGSTEERLTWAWQQALARHPSPGELEVTRDVLEKHRREYKETPGDAEALISVGNARLPETPAEIAEWAAWISVARILINLHESITRS